MFPLKGDVAGKAVDWVINKEATRVGRLVAIHERGDQTVEEARRGVVVLPPSEDGDCWVLVEGRVEAQPWLNVMVVGAVPDDGEADIKALMTLDVAESLTPETVRDALGSWSGVDCPAAPSRSRIDD